MDWLALYTELLALCVDMFDGDLDRDRCCTGAALVGEGIWAIVGDAMVLALIVLKFEAILGVVIP